MHIHWVWQMSKKRDMVRLVILSLDVLVKEVLGAQLVLVS
jgi:hypothetical protein